MSQSTFGVNVMSFSPWGSTWDTECYAHSQHIVQEISFAPEKPVPPMFAA